jgi:mannose-6-phosphate isomerase-like protein (cupin superfamily)
MSKQSATGYEVVDIRALEGVACPCGTARRAFTAAEDLPLTIHETDISHEAQAHYHRRLTEVYYVLECGPDAEMELDGQRVPLVKGRAVRIPPGVRHRAIGEMKVLVIVSPKFDPGDEWFD